MYIEKTIIKIFLISIMSIIVPVLIQSFMEPSFTRIIITAISSAVSIAGCTYIIGLETSEKEVLKNKIQSIIQNYKSNQ